MSKLRIGLVGAGFISSWHYQGFLKNPDTEVVGICSRTFEKARSLAAQWNIKAYESFDDLAEDPNIEALVICSYNPAHYGQIMKAIKQGKHILVEKPVVADFEQLHDIKTASEKKGVLVFPAHNFVYRESTIRAKEIINNGGIGSVIYASFASTQTIGDDLSFGWRSKLESSHGGALMDSGHHLVYMSLFFNGMPSKIQCFKSNLLLKHMEGEDIAQINLVYPNGALGNIVQSWISGWADGFNGVRILGDKGCILITDALYHNSEKLSTDVEWADSFGNQAKAFADCIMKGKAPLSTLDDVRDTLKIIYSAYESNDTNQAKVFC